MSTVPTMVGAKRVAGGSFLIENLTPNDAFTPEDFSLEQRQIAETTAEFAENRIATQVAEIEAKNFEISRALMREAGKLGLLAVDVPEEYGGVERGKGTSGIIGYRISCSGGVF